MPEPIETVSATGKRSWWLYAAGFLAVQVVLLPMLVVLGLTHWFMFHNTYPGMNTMGYTMEVQHKDCDVVLYGDSSALTGLDPHVVSRMTGLSACNVAVAGVIQGVVGSDYGLDAYLSHNKRPKYLLMMFTPSLFMPQKPPFVGYQPDGMAFALRYVDHSWLLGQVRHRPWLVGTYAFWVLKYGLWSGQMVVTYLVVHSIPGLSGPAEHQDTLLQRVNGDGVWPLPLPPESNCVRGDLKLRPDAIGRYAESVAAMRRKYEVDGTKVVIDIAPVPECDTLIAAYRDRSAGLRDNDLLVLPIADFNQGDVHFSEAGVARVSEMAGRQILALEQQAAASGTVVAKP